MEEASRARPAPPTENASDVLPGGATGHQDGAEARITRPSVLDELVTDPSGSVVDVGMAGSMGVALAALAIYLALSPSVTGDKDAGEFTLQLAANGVVHPTGYPLYTLMGHGFGTILHALGTSWAFASNAWSAVGGAAAMGFFHALAARLPAPRTGLNGRKRSWLALLPTLLLALHPAWTVETTLAEVYSWHMAWVCGMALYSITWLRQLRRNAAGGNGPLLKKALFWGVLLGLGAAHHVTASFFAVVFLASLLMTLWGTGRLRWWVAPALIAPAIVPMSSYLFVYYRAFHPVWVQWPALGPSFRSFADHVMATQYHHYLGHFNPSAPQRQVLATWVYTYLFPGLLILLVFCLRDRHSSERTLRWSLFLSAGMQLAYNFNYGVSDPVPYFLPCLAVALLSLALLGAAVLSSTSWNSLRARSTAALVSLGLLLPVAPWIQSAHARKMGLTAFEEYLHSLWIAIPVETGIVLWPDDMTFKLKGYQWFRGEKRGLDIYNTSLLTLAYPRTQFQRKYGFDPLEGAEAWSGRTPGRQFFIGEEGGDQAVLFATIHETIVRRSKVPVIAFEPQKESVRLFPARDSQPR